MKTDRDTADSFLSLSDSVYTALHIGSTRHSYLM